MVEVTRELVTLLWRHDTNMGGLRARFLWKATETIVDPKEEAIGEDTEVIWPAIKVFKWTGMNDYVALCEKDSVSFGGGYETLCLLVKDLTDLTN